MPSSRPRRKERGDGLVEVGAQLAALAAFTEERAEQFFVPPPLGDELVPPLRLRDSATPG